MTSNITSSATKLSQILLDASQLDGKTVTSEVWKQILKFDPVLDRTIENKYLTLLQLFQVVKNDLNELAISGTNTEKFSLAIDEIIAGMFSLSLTAPWIQVVGKIDRKNLYLLESCGEQLMKSGKGFKDISSKEIDGIISEIDKSINEIDSLDIDDNIKRSLTSKLNKIRKSLEDYEVFGAAIFHKDVDDAFMETVVIDRHTDKSNWSKDDINKYKTILDFILKLTTIAEKIYPHIQPWLEARIHYLPPGN